MSQKRFDVVLNEFDEIEYITDIVDCEDRDFADFLDYANELANENKELKSKLEESKKAHSNCDKLWWELHDEKEQLEKENEELKSEIQKLKNVSTNKPSPPFSCMFCFQNIPCFPPPHQTLKHHNFFFTIFIF